MSDKNEIVLYQPDEAIKLEVRLEGETVWLTQAQIVILFESSKANISEHIKNIYEQRELEEKETVRNFRTVQSEGNRNVTRNITYYNLDAIISIGFRVNSKRGIQFRQWANRVLKDYLLKGYSVNNRIERLEQRVTETENKIDFFVRTSLPPVEGIFYDGQMLEPFAFVNNLIRSARKRIVLIDNYIDDSVLLRLAERASNVSATIYTQQVSPSFAVALERYNAEYLPIEVHRFTKSHDRFLIIDSDIYHIGASIKDLGKKWFAFCKMQLQVNDILHKLES